jgi:murein DD-endopeptidase MepM/ murein hydrolase activator NlpD
MASVAPLHRALILLALGALGAVAAVATMLPPADAGLLLAKTAVRESLPIQPAAGLLPSPATYIREERFARGDTFAEVLARLQIGTSDARRILALRQLRLLRIGSDVSAEVRENGELVWLAFPVSRTHQVRLERVGENLVASEMPTQSVLRNELRSAAVRSSLFSATDGAGIPDAIAIQLADVFGGDIDFHRELRAGDRFSVLYEMHIAEGRTLRAGRVLAAEFVNQGRTLRALRFGDGYYAPDGKNMRKAFLRAPLGLTRVSSGFGMRRHPFLQSWRAHQGVDYAAPTGTSVRAVSDGVVQFAGRNGGYGNVVMLRHQGSYSTLYAHLNGFARGIRAGARVSQGDTLGSVGSTGWATGPHLHYEFRVGGVARNPLSVALPAGVPVAPHDLPAFRAHAQPLIAQLDQTSVAALATPLE